MQNGSPLSAKALAVHVLRQSNLAEEIMPEAFLTVCKNPGAYDQKRGTVKSWLMGMVHQRARSALGFRRFVASYCPPA